MAMSLSKRIGYTAVTLLLAAALIAGGMGGMRALLHARVESLLEESGVWEAPAPVREWQGLSPEQGEQEQDGQPPSRLTLRQIEEAVSYWESAQAEILHEPVEGQLSMEEAIVAGKDWLERMGVQDAGEETSNTLVNAMLSVGRPAQEDGQEPELEPYYSFWTVRFYAASWSAVLALNAVSGDVWGGSVTVSWSEREWDVGEILESFVQEAGLEIDLEDLQEQTRTNGSFVQITAPIRDSALCAMAAVDKVQGVYYDAGLYQEEEEGYGKSHVPSQAAVGERETVNFIFQLSIGD